MLVYFQGVLYEAIDNNKYMLILGSFLDNVDAYRCITMAFENDFNWSRLLMEWTCRAVIQ